MAIRSFSVRINNVDEVIEFEDDLEFGILDSILSKCLDTSKINEPKSNQRLFNILILGAVIKKAPFNAKNQEEIRKLPTSVVGKIVSEVTKVYPLVKYLGESVEQFMGETIDINQAYTTSSQENLDGLNNK